MLSGNYNSGALCLLLGSIVLCIASCEREPVRRTPIPKQLLDGKPVYLGQSISEVEQGRELSKEDWFGDYYQQIRNGPFDKVGYAVKWGVLRSVYLNTFRPKREDQVDYVVAALNAEYRGVKPEVVVDSSVNVITWEWKLDSSISAVMYAMWRSDSGEPKSYSGLFLYIGPVE